MRENKPPVRGSRKEGVTATDPKRWSSRRRQGVHPTATHSGGAVPLSTYRQNGKLFANFVVDERASRVGRPTRTPMGELRRRRAKQLSIYRQSGGFSADELSVIEAILNGRS